MITTKGNAEKYLAAGDLFHSQGKLKQAIKNFEAAQKVEPENSDVYYNLGICYQMTGQINQAVIAFKKALKITPNDFEINYNLATAYLANQNYHQATDAFKKCLNLNPKSALALIGIGVAYQHLGELKYAIKSFKKSLLFEPKNPMANNNLGVALGKQKDILGSIKYFLKAIKEKPDYASAINNLGIAYQQTGKMDQAIASYKKALEISPGNMEVYINLSMIQKDLNKIEEATDNLWKAYRINSKDPVVLSYLFHLLRRSCSWQDLKKIENKLATINNEDPLINISRTDNPSLNFAAAKTFSQNFIHSLENHQIHFKYTKKKTAKIRIGYLNNFEDKPIAYLTQDLFSLHNRKKFEIFCYSYGKSTKGEFKQKVAVVSDKFADLNKLNDIDAATYINRDQIDILVDLKGYTKDHRLQICVLRPAPIQVSFLGMPGTTGAPFFDYIITDKILTPKSLSRFYSEKFAFMPDCYQVNSHLEISKEKITRSTLGLPPNSFIYCCFNQSVKIEPEIFDVWMRILKKVPDSILWLYKANNAAQSNLKKAAGQRGVAPDRLIFAEKLPLTKHLTRLKLADLCLDTKIYSGGATTSHSLWTGVPVITIQGRNYASRMSSSLLNAIGLQELITRSLKEYEDLAVELATNPKKLHALRLTLNANKKTHPLFNTRLFTKNLEKAFKEIWGKYINAK